MAGSVSKVVDLQSKNDSKHPALNCLHPRVLKIHLSEPAGHFSPIMLLYLDAETPVPPTSSHREIRLLLMLCALMS